MLLMLTGLALADLAPPPEIITQVQKPCTIAEQCDATQEGTTCTESTSDPFACSKLKDDGYERMADAEIELIAAWIAAGAPIEGSSEGGDRTWHPETVTPGRMGCVNIREQSCETRDAGGPCAP